MRVVIPSVNYADFLSVTLPAWRRQLPDAEIVVVTSPEDRETQDVGNEHAAIVRITSLWTDDGSVFNKAAALDFAFGFSRGSIAPPSDGQWCLALDADVYPFGKLKLPESTDRILYSVLRYSCITPEALQMHVQGKWPLSKFPRIQMWKKRRIPDPAGLLGYFQMWRYREGDAFGSYPTAAKYDVHFGRGFAIRKYLKTPYVLHLGEHRKNWSGRVTPRWDGRKDIHSGLAQPAE